MKYSKQRELIFNYLKNTTSHPTAEQIYSDLKLSEPSLSLATVYRNLNLLSEIKSIQKLDTGETVDRFDADISMHHHFICDCCHRVTDIFTDVVDKELLLSALPDGTEVESTKLYVYGTCEKCKKIKNN